MTPSDPRSRWGGPHRLARRFPLHSTLAWGALLTLGVAGCASVDPAPTLEVPTEASWAALGRGAAESQDAQELSEPLEDRWWTRFEDPQLEALVEESLAANHDLAAAAARLDQAVIQARIAGADLAPQVSAGFSGSRRKQNFIGFPIPGGEEEVLSSTTTSFGVSLDISWEVDLWGRLRAGRDAAGQDLAAARAEYAAARLSLAAQTSKAYFAVREATLQRDLTRDTVLSRRDSSAQVRRRYEAGLRTALDLRLAQTNEEVEVASLEGRESVLEAARRQLEVLLGRYPSGRVLAGDLATGDLAADETGDGSRVADAVELPQLPAPVPAGLPAELVARRPDLAAAERRVVAAGLRVEQARAALYPGLSLTASAGTSSQELADLLDGDFSVWSVAGGLLQPIFQGGRLRAAVELQQASQDQALAAYAQSALRAFSEVETALASERRLQAQMEALDRATEQARGAERLSQERYLAGLVDYLTVLETQRQAQSSESQFLDARRQLLVNRIDLMVALGGGLDPEAWPAPKGLEADGEPGSSPANRERFPDAPLLSAPLLSGDGPEGSSSNALGSSAQPSSASSIGPSSRTPFANFRLAALGGRRSP